MANIGAWSDMGGYWQNTQFSKTVRFAAQQQLALAKYVSKAEEALGSLPGAQLEFTKVGNMSQQYATVPLHEKLPIPEDTAAVTTGLLTVDEWGRAFPYTHKLEALSVYNPQDTIQKSLLNHLAKTTDYRIAQQFKSTYIKYVPDNGTATTAGKFDTDGTLSYTAARDLNALDLRTAKNWLEDVAFAEPFSGTLGNGMYSYVFAASATTINNLLNDPEIRTRLDYAYMGQGDRSPMVSGKIPVWQNIAFVVDNLAFSLKLGTTAYHGEAVMFGADAVIMKPVEKPGIRVKAATDYGRSKGMAWYGIDGYKIVWGDNTNDVPTMDTNGYPTTSNTAVQARVVHFTSL